MGTSEIDIKLATLGDAKFIALLQYRAFLNKFRSMIAGKEEHAREFMERYYCSHLDKDKHNIYIAKKGFEGVGILVVAGKGIPTIKGMPSLSNLSRSMRVLGIFKFLKFIAGLLILDSKPGVKDSLYVSTIAVASEYRGKGIGKMLMDKAESLAREKGLAGSCLYVATDNETAINLYEKKGYIKAKEEKYPFLKWMFGVSGFYFMKKRLVSR
ncbi:MAG: GNAT family N-acetyltransferase [Candidatus Hodarchaeales archaeon]